MVIIGILKQAGNARTQTDIEEEKEIINLAIVGAMNKSKYGDIDETYFTNELEKNNATVIKSGSKFKVTFPSGRQYTVDQDGNVKEKQVNPNALEISELNENASTYFGWDVINYAETLPAELQDTEWQLFYAGALDGETEERIYLISKEYIKNTLLPSKNGVAPIPTEGSDYKAKFSTYQWNAAKINDGVCQSSIYAGSSVIALGMQKYNKDYFKDYTSTNPNMRAVAYMLDTNIWSPFARSTQNYAEWAIGGPTVELLFKAYNKYAGTAYESDAVSSTGYKVRKKSSNTMETTIGSAIANDTSTVDSPYSVSNLTSQANGYLIASPSDNNKDELFRVYYGSELGGCNYSNMDIGFRALVLLNSNYTLEKTKDTNGNDAFKIVEQ